MKKLLLLLLVVGLLSVSMMSCKKKRLEKDLYGSYYNYDAPRAYSDSSTNLLWNCESLTFSKGETGMLSVNGDYSSDVTYVTEKTKETGQDLEIVFSNLSDYYEAWLPKNYVNGQNGLENTVVPNVSVLSQAKFFVKIEDSNIVLTIKYPNSSDKRTYKNS